MKLLGRLVGAVLLGIGTIFGVKSNPDAHWAEPPNLSVSIEEAADESGRGEPE